MRLLSRRVERPLDAAVQCPHEADARHHGRPIKIDDQEQGFDGGLPVLEQLLGLRKLRDVSAGILKGDELATAGKWNRIGERSFPARLWPNAQRRIPSEAWAAVM
jgi:hypothetical protein